MRQDEVEAARAAIEHALKPIRTVSRPTRRCWLSTSALTIPCPGASRPLRSLDDQRSKRLELMFRSIEVKPYSRPSLPRTACFLLTAHLLAQQPDNLLERIRNSHLPAEKQQALAASFSAKDLASVEQMLDREVAAAGRSPLAAELDALAGAVEFLHGRMGRAALAFSQADTLTPLGDPDRFTWAMALVNLGDGKGAREQLTRLAANRPDAPLYIYWLARIDYDQRRYEDAIEKFNRVIRLDPLSPRAYDNLGLALDMSGRPDEAREVFLEASGAGPEAPDPSPWPPHDSVTLRSGFCSSKTPKKHYANP